MHSDSNTNRLLARTTGDAILPEGVPIQTHHPLAEIELADGVQLADLAALLDDGSAIESMPVERS